jgi:hypothetical protein
MGAKSDKLFGKTQSASDTLRVWAIKFLEDISGAVSPPGGLATETTLLALLSATIDADQDIEILLVRDTVTLIVYQQITDYQTGVPVVTYKDVNGAPFVPTNPMEYLDPSAVLNLILAELIILATPVASIGTSLLVVSTPGAASVAAGKRSVSFMNTSDLDCEVNGVTLAAGLSITYPLLSDRDTYDAIAYNALTGELTITTVG